MGIWNEFPDQFSESNLYDGLSRVRIELADGHVEVVEIDAQKGPLLWRPHGEPRAARPEPCIDRGQMDMVVGYKRWKDMTASEQKNWVHIIAKKNKALKENSDTKDAAERQDRSKEASALSVDELYKQRLQKAGEKAFLRVEQMLMRKGRRLDSPERQRIVEDGTHYVYTPNLILPRGEGKNTPLLVCWYSGGFFASEGEQLLAPFLAAGREYGFGSGDTLILHHPNEYDFTSEGYSEWPDYVDRLVKQIDKVSPTRPLILFGHSKGTCPCLSVATRCGSRVLKVYIVGTSSWGLSQSSPWEHLSHEFKKQGNRALLAWFSSLNPSVKLLQQAAQMSDDELQETLKSSTFLRNKVNLMRTQYRDAMYPDMSSSIIDQFPADIAALALAYDPDAGREKVKGFKEYTSGQFEIFGFDAGHMDCLANPAFHRKVFGDMQQYFP